MKIFALRMVLLIAVLVTGSALLAAQEVIINRDRSGRVLDGYDVVSYFTQNRAVKGSDQYSYDWGGATWLFSNARNRDLFKADPARYQPEYGGFCAYAASRNAVAGVDPNAFSVVDDKLYLNFSRGVHRRWTRDIPGNVLAADRFWPGLRRTLLES